MSSIERHYEFSVEAPREDVFSLLGDARNLNLVTPGWFNLRILSGNPEEMREGAEIEYRLRWRGLRFRWRSRVLVWKPCELFVYEQARGPFRGFVHEHYFFEQADGTRVVDRVIYEPPGGRLSDRLVVASDLDRIFSFREQAVRRTLALDSGASVRLVAVAD